jgi:hypothetical protein
MSIELRIIYQRLMYMKKANLIIIILLILFVTACSKNNGSVLKLGKGFNKENLAVSQETDFFTRNDNFAYSLSSKQPFGVETINRRLYKGKVYADLLLKESTIFKLLPDTKVIGDSFPAGNILNKYGNGNYMLLFVINDVVVARKAFSVQEQGQIKNEKPETDTNAKVVEEIPEKLEKHAEQQADGSLSEEKKPENPIIPKAPEKEIETTQPESPRKNIPAEEIKQKKPAINVPSPSEMMNDGK